VTSDENTARELFAAIDSGDIDGVQSLLTEDVAFRFGSAEATTGKAAIAANAAALAGAVESLSHDMLAVWSVEQPEPAVLCEMTVTYRRHDGSQVILPCCTILRLRDGRVADYRIYMDVNPVFAAQGV
jgi:ketosteroid isomerase-like protein